MASGAPDPVPDVEVRDQPRLFEGLRLYGTLEGISTDPITVRQQTQNVWATFKSVDPISSGSVDFRPSEMAGSHVNSFGVGLIGDKFECHKDDLLAYNDNGVPGVGYYQKTGKVVVSGTKTFHVKPWTKDSVVTVVVECDDPQNVQVKLVLDGAEVLDVVIPNPNEEPLYYGASLYGCAAMSVVARSDTTLVKGAR